MPNRLAFAASVDGPYIRNDSGIVPPDLPGEDPWVTCSVAMNELKPYECRDGSTLLVCTMQCSMTEMGFTALVLIDGVW